MLFDVKIVIRAVSDPPDVSVRTVWLKLAPRPDWTVDVNVTLPEKLFELFTVTVELAEEPTTIFTGCGATVMSMPGPGVTMTTTWVELVSFRRLLAPVTATV